MKRLKSNDYEHNLDRLSALPDELIHEILSLLKMRDVVRTSLLSKRWRYLWTTTPCLRFDEFCEDPIKKRNFVSRALTLWRGTHLRKFSIDIVSMDEAASLSSDMDSWVLFAKQRNAEKLNMSYMFSVTAFYCPPQCLYECSSLRNLRLIRCNLRVPGGVKWDCLNNLVLYRCVVSEDVMDQIFASCTQLKTFMLVNFRECKSLSIRSSSLKLLLVSFLCVCDCDGNLEYAMTIDAPNLKVLHLKGRPFNKYLLTNLSSLGEVLLDLTDVCSRPLLGEALCRVLPAIQHVKTLKLSASCFKMLGFVKGEFAFSPLLNVKLLRIGAGVTEISELVGPLEIFPKLKALIVDWECDGKLFEFNGETYTMSEANILKSNLMQLRTVEIVWTRYQISLFQFIECLLNHTTSIEKIVIQKIEYGGTVDSEDDMVLAAQKVVSLQRSFPSVELILRKCSMKYSACFDF